MTKQKPLLKVYSASTGDMYVWINEGKHSGTDNIFYSANSLQPLLETLRKVGCKSDIMVYSDELMEHIKNIKARGDEL